MVEGGEKSIEAVGYFVSVGHEKGSILIGAGGTMCMAI
jgi:hypothetical protein